MRRLTLIALCLTAAACFPLRGAEPAAAAPAVRRIPVLTTPVTRRTFEERVVVQGNVEAKNVAMVPARLKATITALYVDEGDAVKAGETALLRTDDLNLKNALELSRLDLAVAECGVREKEANVERLSADLDRKRKDYERQKRLLDEDKIGTLDSVEAAESGYLQALASLKYGQTLVALAKEQQRQAQTAVRIAEKNLSDAVVLAPISGVVSQRRQEVGEMGDPGTPAFRIVDLSRLEVSAYLPAQYYGAIVVGQTRMTVRVGDVEMKDRLISYRAPTIDPQVRVFEVKCLLETPPDSVAPGAMASVSVVLRRQEGLGVPTEAITQRDDRRVLFRLEADTARQTAVETGMETDGWVEVRSPALAEGMPVVTMGQFLLNDGTKVDVRTGSAKTLAGGRATDAPAVVGAPPVAAAAPGKED